MAAGRRLETHYPPFTSSGSQVESQPCRAFSSSLASLLLSARTRRVFAVLGARAGWRRGGGSPHGCGDALVNILPFLEEMSYNGTSTSAVRLRWSRHNNAPRQRWIYLPSIKSSGLTVRGSAGDVHTGEHGCHTQTLIEALVICVERSKVNWDRSFCLGEKTQQLCETGFMIRIFTSMPMGRCLNSWGEPKSGEPAYPNWLALFRAGYRRSLDLSVAGFRSGMRAQTIVPLPNQTGNPFSPPSFILCFFFSCSNCVL